MQLQQQGTLLRPAGRRGSPATSRFAATAAVRRARRSSVATRYQNDDDIGTAPKQSQVAAEDTYRAAAANMPAGAWAGRWERWAPPGTGFKGGLFRPDAADSAGWQLLTSGQSVYVFMPDAEGGPSLSVSVMEAPDSPPLSMAQAAAQVATEAALSGSVTTPQQQPSQPGSRSQMPSHRSGSVGGSNVMRAENKFSQEDHFFRPYLPDKTQPGGDIGLRLWAADGLGFVMAPTALPLGLLHNTKADPVGAASAAAAASASAVREAAPFIANFYIKHPSHEPGVGRRWGWNLQFDSTTGTAAAAAAGQQGGGAAVSPAGGSLQHIHHTCLGLAGLSGGLSAEDLLHPGPHTRPPTAPRSLPPSIAVFMSAGGHHWLRCNGSAVEFTYEGGRLTRTDTDSGDCGWHVSGGGAAHTAEVWYSSGGYTRCPVSLQAELAAGRAVTLEAGAIIYRSASLTAPVEGVARWLLTYRAGDGQLGSVRLEVYRQNDEQH